MDQQKNIVLILGNGFDMNLGRSTSYKDFWKTEYCPKKYPAPLIHHLNNTWNDNLDAVKWYDLENELLEYFRSTTKPDYKDLVTAKEQEFLEYWKKRESCHINEYERYSEQINSLIEKGILTLDHSWHIYMDCPDRDELTLSHVSRDYKALKLIKAGLCDFLKSIDANSLNKHSVALSTLRAITEAREAENDVKVYSFNYTELPYNYEGDLEPQYIHGRCRDENIIIGTKDSQEFNRDYDFFQKSFDPSFKTPPVVYDLLNADDVIIFGHSLGMNDSQYFKPFFSQQTNIQSQKRKRITIFTKDERSILEIKRSLQMMTDYNLSLLNSLNDLEIIPTDKIPTNGRPFKAFIERYVSDKHLVRALLTMK